MYVVIKKTSWSITLLRRRFHAAMRRELSWHQRSPMELKWKNLSLTFSSSHGSLYLYYRVVALTLVESHV